MPEQTFLGTFEQYCAAHPREDFEALRPKYQKLKEEAKRQNEITGAAYLRRLEADKAQKQRERKLAAENERRAKEQDMKTRQRAIFSALSDEQFEHAWPRIFEDLISAEVREREAAFRKNYQF
jgi:hypothetical protein